MTQTITLWGCVIVFACAVAMAQKRLSTPPKIASGPSCAGPVTKTGKKGLQACRSASSSKTTFFGIECRGSLDCANEWISTWSACEPKAVASECQRTNARDRHRQ
jgi:hypothetical protein